MCIRNQVCHLHLLLVSNKRFDAEDNQSLIKQRLGENEAVIKISIHGARIGKNAREVGKERMNCLAIFVVLDVLLMSAVLARPDKTMRSDKYSQNLKSASSTNTTPDKVDKEAQAYISSSGFDGQHGGINIGHRGLFSERVGPPPQITTRREYGVRHSGACLSKTKQLNPKTYFNTDDNFLPASYKTTACTGSLGQRGYPNCVYGVLDCVTIYEDITFVRKPSGNCAKWYNAIIKDVPVGCECMWPN